jgi:hypothetical protein
MQNSAIALTYSCFSHLAVQPSCSAQHMLPHRVLPLRLHHVNIDRLLQLYQASTGQYVGLSNYQPFPSDVACGPDTQECGYTYEERIPPTPTSGLSAGDSAAVSAQLAGRSSLNSKSNTSDSPQRVITISSQSSTADAVEVYEPVAAPGGDANSTTARRYLQQYIQRLTGGYNGYPWSAVIDGLNPMVLRGQTYAVHVLVNDGACANVRVPTTANGRHINMLQLRQMDAYCGSNAGWNTMGTGMASNRVSALNRVSCICLCRR